MDEIGHLTPCMNSEYNYFNFILIEREKMQTDNVLFKYSWNTMQHNSWCKSMLKGMALYNQNVLNGMIIYISK